MRGCETPCIFRAAPRPWFQGRSSYGLPWLGTMRLTAQASGVLFHQNGSTEPEQHASAWRALHRPTERDGDPYSPMVSLGRIVGLEDARAEIPKSRPARLIRRLHRI